MRIACLHEVYFEPKMFQTIGFHHQGSYRICVKAYSLNEASNKKQYGFPILTRKFKMDSVFQEDEYDGISSQKLQYYTKLYVYNEYRFDVSFNEQQFIFNGGCRFKIEDDIQANPNLIIKLQISLIKHSYGESRKENEGKKAMISAQNIIKITSEDPRDSSNQKIISSELGDISNKQRRSIQTNVIKQQEEVSMVQLTIDCAPDCLSKPSSVYQTVIFPNQQYFGKMYFLVSHVKIGFKIRAKSLKFSQFVNQGKQSRSDHPSTKYHQQRSSCTSEIFRNSISSIMSSTFTDVKTLFQALIRSQVVQLHKLGQIEELMLSQQNSSLFFEPQKSQQNYPRENFQIISSRQVERKNLPNKLQSKKHSLDIQVSIPSQQVASDTESLLDYFECESEQDLYQTIYQEQRRLSEIIISKWHYLILLLGAQKWSNSYYHRTIKNFQEEVQYIKCSKLKNQLEPNAQYVNWEPKLKYRIYIHLGLPNLYRNISKSIQRPVLAVSSEHVLFVLVHGFNGNQSDMSRIKSFISCFCTPHFLVLKSISTRILQHLDTIGKAAAEEISDFLKIRPFIKKINFVGFSLGGVIIRSCLRYLKNHYNKFHMLMTLSSPHLGVKQLKSCIVKTGMKVLQKFRGAKNIKQLLLDVKDNKLKDKGKEEGNEIEKQEINIEQHQQSYLELLAKDTSISQFAIVVAIGCQDDKYVPGFSATLDYQGDDERVRQMQENLKRNIGNLHQVYVKFSEKKQGSLWQRITGRRVHINFLDDDSFLYFVLSQYFYIF